MASKGVFCGLLAMILAAGVNAQVATSTTASPAATTSTAASTDFSCYVNAGHSNTTGALEVMPQPANFTLGDTFCYSAQVPNGTCSNGKCTSYAWIYGVADQQGCDSFKEQATLGYYQNVLCCAAAQCNKPSAAVDTTTETLVNPNVPTITTTTASTSTGTVASTNTLVTASSSNTATTGSTGAITTSTGSTKTTSGAGVAGPGAVVVLFLAAIVAVF